MNTYLKTSLFALIIGTLSSIEHLAAQSEPTYNSPYSILGIGDLVDQQFAASQGMAGLSAAYHDPFHLNPLNPASLGWLRTTAFETAVFGNFAQQEASNGQTDGVWSGNLNYMALGFTLRNPINEALDRIIPTFGAGMMFSLVPYSNVSYDIEVTSPLSESLNSIGAFQGTGGTYRLNWGTGVRYKTFSFGVNLGYLFGRINNTRRVFLEDETVYYFDDFADDINLNGFIWNIGLGYDYEFKEVNKDGELKPNGKKIAFGAYFNTDNSFNTDSDRLYRRVYSITGSSTLPVDLRSDTIVNEVGVGRSGTLPAAFTFGASYIDENKLLVGIEYNATLWSNYQNEAKPDQLNNIFRISAGVEWVPDFLSYNNYLERVRYRLGAFYQNDPRSFDGEQLTKLGATFGMGLPLILPNRQTSFINIALEGGRFGLQDVITENYIKFTLGFTLNDNSWFFKRKFD
ncbi:MAG: hypothetical protein AAF849_11260 [Bacteroidota bacterium]